MTEQPQEEEVPVHEGPDPRNWERDAPDLWAGVLNIEALDRVAAVLSGPAPKFTQGLVAEARTFLDRAREDQRAELSAMILAAFQVPEPEEPTEALGGFSGDGDGKGAGDHLRRVQG